MIKYYHWYGQMTITQKRNSKCKEEFGNKITQEQIYYMHLNLLRPMVPKRDAKTLRNI